MNRQSSCWQISQPTYQSSRRFIFHYIIVSQPEERREESAAPASPLVIPAPPPVQREARPHSCCWWLNYSQRVSGDSKHGRGQYLRRVLVPEAHSITNQRPAHDPGPPSVFRHNNTLQLMRGGMVVTWLKVNARRGSGASITKTWKGRRCKGWCTKCLFLYLWVFIVLYYWLLERNRPADTWGWPMLTSPPSSFWPWDLVPFPLMTSVGALTLPGDSSLQYFGQQSAVLTDLQLLLLQSELDHNWSSLSTSLLLQLSFTCISIQFLYINDMQKRRKCTHLMQKRSITIQPWWGFKKTHE